MGTLDDDFAFVAASVERATGLQRRACRVVLDDRTRRGQALARHLDLAYEAIERQIADRRASYGVASDDEVRGDAIVEMRRLLWFVRDLQKNLAWLEASQQPPLDLGTMYFVENAARVLVASNIEVIVIPAEHASYATSSDPWEPLIEEWGKGIPQEDPAVVVIFIPKREERSGLLHPLIMHELGHAADTQHGLVEEIWQTAKKRARFVKRFSRAVSDFAESQDLDPSDANDHVSERLRYWVAESLCDCIAVHHLGPSYLYSFLAEVAAASLDEPGPKHPSPRQRIRLLVEHLDKIGWSGDVKTGNASLDAWVKQTCAGQLPPYSDIDQFLTWAVDELKAVVRKRSQRLLDKRVFSPDKEELVEVRDLLRAGIPPAQRRTGEAVAQETIMLACWHAALDGSDDGMSALANAPDTPQLADILPAALELSALTNAWRAT